MIHAPRQVVGSSAAALLLLWTSTEAPAARGASPAPVLVRASAAFAPCLEPALAAFSRESGIATLIDVNEPDPPGEADVVVGDDVELQRLLEGGTADLGSSFDLGYIPWVFVVPERSPKESVSALAAADRVYALGGKVGLEGRKALTTVSAERVRLSRDASELRKAAYALVPRSLAGPGEHRPAGIRALVATAAVISNAGHPVGARQLLAFLKGPRGRATLVSCVDASETGDSVGTSIGAGVVAYGAAVLDWWLPACSLQRNGYNDPEQVLGPPDAVNFGGKDNYQGIMSLGQGGYVTLDMGVSAVDGPGADLRVFQTTSREEVTLYAATNPQGPFVLVGLRVQCGTRSPGLLSNHCDFDLHDGALSEARYLKVEDGEIYPCLAGGTLTEGADIDAVQILNVKP